MILSGDAATETVWFGLREKLGPTEFLGYETESAEGVRGDSANNVQKPVTLETGITVQVPLFIKTGEKIKVDTRTGKYMERA